MTSYLKSEFGYSRTILLDSSTKTVETECELIAVELYPLRTLILEVASSTFNIFTFSDSRV